MVLMDLVLDYLTDLGEMQTFSSHICWLIKTKLLLINRRTTNSKAIIFSCCLTLISGSSSVVEHLPSKQDVAGSTPVSRSTRLGTISEYWANPQGLPNALVLQ